MNSSEREFWCYTYCHLYPHICMPLNTRLSHSKCPNFASTISKAPEYFPLTIFLLLLFCCCCFLLFSKSRTFSTLAFHSAWSLALLLYIFGYIKSVKRISCFCENLFKILPVCESLFFLWESLWISSVYEYLFISFLSVRISSSVQISLNLLLFMIICENLFFLWESFWISSYFWSSVWIYVFVKMRKRMNAIILLSKTDNDILLISHE